ncbi:MAG: cupredoxin domain-containing protein [Nitriliruptoraceae bacterium]
MRVRLLLATSLLAVGLAACGGDDSSETSNGTAATAVTIEAGDLFFAPETLNVSAEGVAITLENIGLVEHNLVIDEVGLEMYVDVNDTAIETVVLSPGSYDFYCSIPGHREAGMEGVITAS